MNFHLSGNAYAHESRALFCIHLIIHLWMVRFLTERKLYESFSLGSEIWHKSRSKVESVMSGDNKILEKDSMCINVHLNVCVLVFFLSLCHLIWTALAYFLGTFISIICTFSLFLLDISLLYCHCFIKHFELPECMKCAIQIKLWVKVSLMERHWGLVPKFNNLTSKYKLQKPSVFRVDV